MKKKMKLVEEGYPGGLDSAAHHYRPTRGAIQVNGNVTIQPHGEGGSWRFDYDYDTFVSINGALNKGERLFTS